MEGAADECTCRLGRAASGEMVVYSIKQKVRTETKPILDSSSTICAVNTWTSEQLSSFP